MDAFEVELSDFDAAAACLGRSGDDEARARRAARAALDHLYSLEQQRVGGPGYWKSVERSPFGRTCAALTFLRGRAVHRLVQAHEHVLLVPSEDLAPSEHLAPCANWEWHDWDVLDARLPIDPRDAMPVERQRLRRQFVEERLADRLILVTLAEARAFLAQI